MHIIIETQRLILRLFTEKDALLIYDLNREAAVTKYTHDPVSDIDHAKKILERVILPQYVLYNYGRWAVHLKPGLTFTGWCGLKYRAELNEIDLGFRFKKEYWGHGYATEAAFASITYGFEKLNVTRIVGRAEPENSTSCKVLEKCGMQYTGKGIVDGYTVNTYEKWNPGFEIS